MLPDSARSDARREPTAGTVPTSSSGPSPGPQPANVSRDATARVKSEPNRLRDIETPGTGEVSVARARSLQAPYQRRGSLGFTVSPSGQLWPDWFVHVPLVAA